MRIPCPTCKRRGTVDKVFPEGMSMSYCGPNGERWPQETCQTCIGSGWVNDNSLIKTDAERSLEDFGVGQNSEGMNPVLGEHCEGSK